MGSVLCGRGPEPCLPFAVCQQTPRRKASPRLPSGGPARPVSGLLAWWPWAAPRPAEQASSRAPDPPVSCSPEMPSCPVAQAESPAGRGAPRVAPPAGRGKATRVSCGCPITAPHVGWRGLETPHTDPLGSEAGRLTSAAAGACGAPLRLVQLLCPPEALACPSASARGPPSLSHIFL